MRALRALLAFLGFHRVDRDEEVDFPYPGCLVAIPFEARQPQLKTCLRCGAVSAERSD